MKLMIKFFQNNNIIERQVEFDDIVSAIDNTISQVGGSRQRFRVFCEKSVAGLEEYLIYRDYKKVAAVQVVSL